MTRANETRGTRDEREETMNATCTKMTKGYDLAKQDRWVIREIKSMKTLRANGHRDFKDLTDSQITGIATKLARFYSVGTTYTHSN